MNTPSQDTSTHRVRNLHALLAREQRDKRRTKAWWARAYRRLSRRKRALERQAEHVAVASYDCKIYCESLLKRIGELEHQLSDDNYILWEEHLATEKERELEDAAFWGAIADVDGGAS